LYVALTSIAKVASESQTHPTQTASKQTNGTPEEISFVLVCHPDEKSLPQLANKYLRTSRQLTVLHLYKFLAKKLLQDDFKTFSIYVSSNLLQELSEELTLDAIEKEVFHKQHQFLPLIVSTTTK
jgi:hypothetical protein